MRSIIFMAPLLVVFLWGCASDDQDPPPVVVSELRDFTILGEDLENVYQYTYRVGGEGEVVNLTQLDNLSKQFLTLRQNGETLTFYTFSEGNFSAIQRNVQTGESRFLENIYNVSDDRSVIWGTNSPEKLFFGYYSPRGSNNFGMRTVDIFTEAVTDFPIEANVQNVYEPLYYSGKLFVTYRSATGEYRTLTYDASDLALLASWDFGSAIPSVFIGEAGDVVIITGAGGNSYLQTLYDFDTLEKLEETPFDLNRFFPPGPLEAQLIGNRLYYLNFYAQPSLIPFGPAIYDFILKENRIIDMVGIVQELEQESGEPITLTAYGYLAEGKTFMLGYTRDFNSGLFQGGVLVISETGEVLENIQTPFIPIYFVKS